MCPRENLLTTYKPKMSIDADINYAQVGDQKHNSGLCAVVKLVLSLPFPQEIIQNADDAGARTVKFFLDRRQHGTESVVERDLAKHQGPALLAYNDAQFTEKDWEGIQNLQHSCKEEDPFKVGKFGIGFNSVYHITGMGSLYNNYVHNVFIAMAK